jgi:sterol 3beta-glucosyltransferase
LPLLTLELQENGVKTAINAIYRDLDYARSLIKTRADNPPLSSADAAALAGLELADDEGEIEETWTFIGDDGDAELKRLLMENAASSAATGRAPRVSLDVLREGFVGGGEGERGAAVEKENLKGKEKESRRSGVFSRG